MEEKGGKMFLVTIETVKIKDYLFSTNKLKVIRGASYLLDYLNQVVVNGVLAKNGITTDSDSYLYVAAGNAKFLVETEEKAKEIIKKVEKAYKNIAPGAKLATSYVEQGKNEEIWNLMDESAKKTAEIKNKGFKEINYHLSFVKKCKLCESNAAEIDEKNINREVENYSENFNNTRTFKNKATSMVKSIIEELKKEKDGSICKECLTKLIASEMVKPDNKEIGFYSMFKDKFENQFSDFEMAKTIEDYKDNKSFIGFIYADGDGLGDFLSKVKNKFVPIQDKVEADKQYRKFLKEFSINLDKVTKMSLIEAIEGLRDKFPTHGKDNDKRYYGEFLIVGGDDVCGVFPADLALELSEKYQAIFEKKMYEYFEKNKDSESEEINNITTSSGVIIAKAKTPMYLLFEQSLKLQKSAKKARYIEFKNKKDEKKHGYTDFQVIGSEGNVDISKFREENKLKELINRPYEVSGKESQLLALINRIRDFKKSDFPRNKIRKFYDLKRMGESTEALYEFVNLYSKLTDEQKLLLEIDLNKDMELKDILGNIFDILEMYSFVQEGDVK